jgi:hypothetical protein
MAVKTTIQVEHGISGTCIPVGTQVVFRFLHIGRKDHIWSVFRLNRHQGKDITPGCPPVVY